MTLVFKLKCLLVNNLHSFFKVGKTINSQSNAYMNAFPSCFYLYDYASDLDVSIGCRT